jgi:hypothetical protein
MWFNARSNLGPASMVGGVSVLEAERDAKQLLDASWWWEDAAGPLPVDPFEVARDLGLTVQFRPLSLDESGHIVIPRPGSGPVVITLNSFDHPNRQRFTCAHGQVVASATRNAGVRPVLMADSKEVSSGVLTSKASASCRPEVG